jgi:DNA repair protein RecO (recombination protein O)
MSARIELQPAWVLHTRPYQNSSLLVDFLSLDFGRLRAVARGARRAGSRTRALLQPFHPLLISLAGRHELKTLTAVESSHGAMSLQGTRLFSGLYLNELLARLLLSQEAHADLYRSYQQAIIALSAERDVASTLRRFELELLETLGYGLNLEVDCRSGEPITAQGHYLFLEEEGFERIAQAGHVSSAGHVTFTGAELCALRHCDFTEAAHGRAALRLTRLALQRLLGDKPLASRELFLSARARE